MPELGYALDSSNHNMLWLMSMRFSPVIPESAQGRWRER